jgi:catechol 2,3-dioxygenase-like lactoylglutathione lyase family enzyme
MIVAFFQTTNRQTWYFEGKNMRTIILIAALVALTTIKPIQKMEPRFTVLTLGVDNLEKSLAFYRDGLGLPTKGIIGKEFEHGEVVFFDLNHNIQLALYPRKDLAWDANTSQAAASPTEFSIGYNVRKKEAVDELMTLAQKAGARITKPAQKAFWGGYHGYFQDPDGHLWEIVYNPNWNPDAL